MVHVSLFPFLCFLFPIHERVWTECMREGTTTPHFPFLFSYFLSLCLFIAFPYQPFFFSLKSPLIPYASLHLLLEAI